jgi:GH25 family lysozyme M1 (1,4-beta-N-acetylmuramidase)
MMLEVTPKLLRAANAGSYEPSILGYLKSPLYSLGVGGIQSLLPVGVEISDISFYQVIADFNRMTSNGLAGSIFRAGQNTWEDSKVSTYMKDANSIGMPFGSYWFYDSRSKPKEQAKLWSEIIYRYDTKLWCWADYEENYGGSYGGWRHFYDFLEYCKMYMPNRKFGVYTGFYYWVEHSPNPTTQAASLSYFKQYPLWEAWYSDNVANVRIPKPWSVEDWIFWQYTSSGDGYKYGVGSREIDLNKFMGTDFNKTFGLENGGETPMPEVNWKGTVISGPAIVRSTPAGADTGFRLAQGDLVEAVGDLVVAGSNGYSWRNIVRPQQGWVADHLLEGDYIVTPTPTAHKLEVFVDGVLEFTKEF